MTKKFSFILLILFAAAMIHGALPARAASDLSYDPYAPVYSDEFKAPSTTKKAANNILTFPFELVRWPVDKGLNYAEKHYLYTKTMWVYDFIQDQGLTPWLGIHKYGVEVDFVRLAHQKVRYPDLVLKGDVVYDGSNNGFFSTGARVGLERIGEYPVHVYQDVRYENRQGENFFGLGPHSSRGDGTTYKMESTALWSTVGYNPTPAINGDVRFGYRNVNITSGKGTIIDEVFNRDAIPGLQGDEILTVGTEFKWDTRNQEKNSTAGHLIRGLFDYNEGLYGSTARYFKMIAEGSKYQTLGSKRRVLAAHFYTEYNEDLPDHEVPFYDRARLGGFGDSPSLSRPLRGFETDRFYDKAAALMNLEYRYTVYEYRDWKMDAVAFWDEGQVFNKLGKFQFNDFRESYGGGLRIGVLNHVLLSLEVAHGDEGTVFYAKTGAPF